MFQDTDEKINTHCSKCGSKTLLESQCRFNEDETMSCQCGMKLRFVHNFNNKGNTYSFA